jgi:alpha-amylase
MKKIIFLFFVLVAISSCKEKEITDVSKIPYTDSVPENAVIYEANIRQYSAEGTFNSFTKDIPHLKKMGVKILWIMPIQEIGLKNRKAFGDKSIEQITDTIEKKKYLGSYYSVNDYRSIGHNYGTKADLELLLKTAHENEMYVILDWVANHTAWDHPWISQHPDYYMKDKDGKIKAPFDWTDVAELDYSNLKMRANMIDDMKYWIQNFGFDGFRCDIAGEVPTDFWNTAVVELKKVKPIFLLAEAEKPELMKKAFDMGFGWEAHHVFNDIAQSKKNISDWDKYVSKKDSLFEKDDIAMNFTSNHDENSWNGSEYERMGDAAETFAALTFVVPGMPLIYSGQEYGLKKRLKFFEKDTIPHSASKIMLVYEKLGKLKNENEALNGGKNPGSYKKISTSDATSILCFEREKNAKKIVFIGNLTKLDKNFTIEIQGNYTDCMTGQKIALKKGQKQNFKPWQYLILTQ